MYFMLIMREKIVLVVIRGVALHVLRKKRGITAARLINTLTRWFNFFWDPSFNNFLWSLF